MKTMGDYLDLYLKTDFLLLVDVFEKFFGVYLEYYGLDPCHYFGSLGLSWDAILKMTDVELELILDIDMYLFVEKGMRGGISYTAKSYSKANNKYMKSYDDSKRKPRKYIAYLDASNLYVWANHFSSIPCYMALSNLLLNLSHGLLLYSTNIILLWSAGRYKSTV